MNSLHKYFYLLGFVAVVGCGEKTKPEPVEPEPTTKGTLKINIIPKYNGAPFTFYTDYYNPLNQRIQFEILKMLFVDFYAKKPAGDSVLIKDAFKFDFETGQMSFSSAMNPNEFTGISFAFGVDSVRNHADPTTYDPSHALSYNQANTLHWGWASGYIFMKFEGKADLSGTGTGTLSQFLAYHPGDDMCFRRTPFVPKTFTVSVGNTTELNLVMDISKFITAASDTFDLNIDNLTHFTDNPGLAKRISTNIANSFSFE